MLDSDTKRRIDSARDILVGKLPNPQSQVEQITIALIYKFMDDMDNEAEALGGARTFFSGEFERYGWGKLMDVSLGGQEVLNRYAEAIEKMKENQNVPQLFRDIFKNAFLPYRDPETLRAFLKTINQFKYDHSERLGDAFEYLLSIMSSQGDAGQFRTPRHIIDFMVALVDPQKGEKILDPACGTAGFLISSYKHILEANSKDGRPGAALTPDERTRLMDAIEGYDISPDMVRLSLVNLYLHGFPTPKIREYDTLTSEEHWNDYADVVMANPPFMSPKGGIRPHKRFSVESNRSEVLFVDYIMEHLTANGRAAVIVPEGIIFQGGTAYKALRKKLVEEDYLVGVISLPAGVFNPYSGVKTSILWLDRALAKKANSIVFCKIEHDGFDLGAQRRPNGKDDLIGTSAVLAKYKTHLAEGTLIAEEEFPIFSCVKKERITDAGEYFLNQDRYSKSSIRSEKYEWIRLRDCAETFIDGDWIESKDQSKGGIRLIQTGNIGFGEYLEKGEKAKFISTETFTRLNCKEVFPGDILISRLPDPVGRACIMPKLDCRMITAVDCTIVRFDQTKCLPSYFVNLTRTDQYYKLLAPYLTGSSRSRISRTNLENISLPVPPLEVQEEIVEEIEGYQKIIDGARMVVENYRPRIEVDPSWPVVKLGEVCEKITDGTHLTPKYVEKGVPFFRVTDITLSNDSKKFISLEEHNELIKRCFPEKGDILYTKNGTIGVAKLIDWDFEFSIFVSLALLKPKKGIINPRYLELVMNSENVQIQAKAHSKTGTITNLHLIEIKEFQIPLPSLELQQLIIDQSNSERSLIENNKELITLFEEKIRARVAKVWGE